GAHLRREPSLCGTHAFACDLIEWRSPNAQRARLIVIGTRWVAEASARFDERRLPRRELISTMASNRQGSLRAVILGVAIVEVSLQPFERGQTLFPRPIVQAEFTPLVVVSRHAAQCDT